jgi:hypothetical protein
MRAAALLLALVGATHGLVSAYHVEPGEKRGHYTKLVVRLVRSTPNCDNAGRA